MNGRFLCFSHVVARPNYKSSIRAVDFAYAVDFASKKSVLIRFALLY